MITDNSNIIYLLGKTNGDYSKKHNNVRERLFSALTYFEVHGCYIPDASEADRWLKMYKTYILNKK